MNFSISYLFLDDVIFDLEGEHIARGIKLRKLRAFVAEKLSDLGDVTDEIALTEDEQYDLHLKLKKL